MNIEELMNVVVTSVSRHEQSLSKTAAIIVITEEALPEACRRDPTLRRQQHSRPPPHGSRCASRPDCRRQLVRRHSRLQRKIQRQSSCHGRRPVYVPSFSGGFYEVLDVPLEQISRIEVIRGPGGSVWGTNAVNAVINILTKKPPLPRYYRRRRWRHR
jgi:iron complex outermembrane receptor protein